MGSFDSTCGVSGLPISAGDPVRYFLVAESPYKNDNIRCYISSNWWVRTVPIKAEYNDYGSIEEWKHSPITDLWLDSLRLDMVEVGVGDNSCHDVAVRKEMSFSELLQAVWEARLAIRQDMPLFPESDLDTRSSGEGSTPASLEGVPSFQKLADDLGSDFLVDEEHYGSVRIRFNGLGVSNDRYGNDVEELTTIQKRFEGQYASMLSVGTGNYANSAQLIVRPLPGTQSYAAVLSSYNRAKGKAPLRVAQTMVREDVWQACLNTEYEAYAKGGILETTSYEVSDDVSILDPPESPDLAAFGDVADMEVIPFTVGPYSMIRQARGRDWDQETSLAFAQSVRELEYVTTILSQARHQWRPTYSNGPQCGEWSVHQQLLSAWGELANKKAVLEELERRKWEIE